MMQEKLKLIENRYNLRKNAIFESRPFRTQKYGIKSLVHLAPKIWSVVPKDKNSATLNTFKNNKKLFDFRMPW